MAIANSDAFSIAGGGDTFGVSQQLSEVLGYVPHVQDGISRYVNP
jgi:3-phosphoglycerate kinase